MKYLVLIIFSLIIMEPTMAQNKLESQISSLFSQQVIVEHFRSQKEFVILPNRVCNKENCDVQKIKASKSLSIYSKEEAFLRGLKDNIQILTITDSKMKLDILISMNGKEKLIRIEK